MKDSKNEKTNTEWVSGPIENKRIGSLVYIIRGKQVMVDSDLAMLYQVETKNLNKAASCNTDRFPEDFRFKLTKEEFDGLKFQSGTSNEGQSRWSAVLSLCLHRTGNKHACKRAAQQSGCPSEHKYNAYFCGDETVHRQ